MSFITITISSTVVFQMKDGGLRVHLKDTNIFLVILPVLHLPVAFLTLLPLRLLPTLLSVAQLLVAFLTLLTLRRIHDHGYFAPEWMSQIRDKGLTRANRLYVEAR